MTNFPDSVDSRGIWNVCSPYGRLVDAFIANKRSKVGKRFGFIRYVGIKDVSDFVRSLSNIWIGSFHLYVSVARFQWPNSNKSIENHYTRGPQMMNVDDAKTNPNPNSKNTSHNHNDMHSEKPSFASVVHDNHKSSDDNSFCVKTRAVTLNDHDLLSVDDTSKVLLVKLKDLGSSCNITSTKSRFGHTKNV
ncbi:RNA-directed DNA polymerase, eukaryota [Tanacetum coccineum]